ncbi:hypothetical protein D3C83_228160 [compost metagenome]
MLLNLRLFLPQHLMKQGLVHAIELRYVLRAPGLRHIVEIHKSVSFASCAVKAALMRLILTATFPSLMPAIAAMSL